MKNSFKLKLKTLLFRMLDRLPEHLGFFIYHFVQDRFGNKNLQQKLVINFGSYKILRKILQKEAISIQGKKIIEIGSGWLPIMPYFLKYFGMAKEIQTYDLNRHFDPKAIKKLNRLFLKNFGQEVKSAGKYNLPEGINYFPKVDLVHEENLQGDLIFSRFVLEHVRPNDLLEMHKKFKLELQPGSYLVHFISPSDHRAYLDKSLSLQDFLQYSPKEWDLIQTKFDYHNRWRLPQYLELFRSVGYEIVHLNYDVPQASSKSYNLFKKLQLHSDFAGYSEEELMAGSISIILKT